MTEKKLSTSENLNMSDHGCTFNLSIFHYIIWLDGNININSYTHFHSIYVGKDNIPFRAVPVISGSSEQSKDIYNEY